MARNFDGIDDLINCGSDISIDNLCNAAMEIFAWIEPDTTGEAGTGRIADKRSTIVPNKGWLFFIDDIDSLGFLTVVTAGADANQRGADSQITLNAWNPVGISYDDDGSKAGDIYVDANEISYATNIPGSITNDKDDSNNGFTIGQDSNTTTRTFDGSIAEMGVWNSILSTIDRTSLSKGIPPILINRANLALCVMLFGVHGSTEPDSSGNDNHGTVTGAIKAPHAPVEPWFNYW